MKNSTIRNTIVETASSLFYQNGYNSTGINEIIREAGIAKATLYSHFKSKEDICIAYLQSKNEVFIEEIKAFALNAPKGDDQILALFEFLKVFFKDKDFNGCWCVKTVAEIPQNNTRIRSEIQTQKKELLDLIQYLLDINYPTHSEEENLILARQVYLLYEGAITEAHLHQEKWPIISAKQICQLVLK